MEGMVASDIAADYKGKRVFVTGHTGFKGSWLIFVLHQAGAIIKGYSLEPNTEPSLFKLIEQALKIDSVIADINDATRLEKEIIEFQPDYIFHLAAQPLVRKSYKEPLNTFATNVMGTANVLNALTKLTKPCSCIIITTDKVYENKEWHYSYREIDQVGGHDPYSASKACAELVVNSYRSSFFNLVKYDTHQKSIASVRAGNVIGGGDWSEDRLIPDIVASIVSNKPIIIRSPTAIRPWQHVLEPIFGYLQLGALLAIHPEKYGGAWNFGPAHTDNLPVMSIAQQAINNWGKGSIESELDTNAPHEATLLKLDISKAINELHWKPRMDAVNAVERTIKWYRNFYEAKLSAIELMESDLLFYQLLVN